MKTGEKTRLTAMLKNEKHSQEVLALNNYLIKYINKPNKLKKETVFQKIYGTSKKFDEAKLIQLRYRLFNLAENFLLINWLTRRAERNKDHLVQKQMMLVEYYKNVELPANSTHTADLAELIKFKLSDIDKTLKRADAKNVDYYFYQHKLNHHYYYGLGSNIWEKGKAYLTKLLTNLDIYYYTTKMRYYSETLNRKNKTNEKYELKDLDQIQQFGKDLSSKHEIILLQLYNFCLTLSNEVNETNLLALVNFTLEKADFLDNRELGFVIPFIVNNITQIKRNEGKDLVETNFKIYNLSLRRNIFETNGLLRPIFLINYTYLCVELGKLGEIDKAWEANSHKIENKHKESTHNLCTAIKAFGENEFEKALKYSRKETVQTVVFYLYKKLLQIKSLYELGNYVKIEEERNNLLRYMRTNKQTLDKSTYDCLFNFTQIIRELIKPNINIKALKAKVEDKSKSFIERIWLLKKVNEK